MDPVTFISKSAEKKSILLWQNWGRTQNCRIFLFFEPESKQALEQEIKKLGLSCTRLRAIGSTHSWAPLFCDGCTANSRLRQVGSQDKPQPTSMISNQFLNTILSLDTKHNLVTCEAGVTLWQLGTFLEAHGLTLPNYPTPGDVTVAGLTQTATHGSGNTSTVSDFIRRIGFFDSWGQYHEVSYDPDQRNEFLTVNVGMGLTGYLYSLTFECVEKQLWDQVTWTGPAQIIFTHLDQWIENYHLEYYNLMYYLDSDTFLLTAYVKSDLHKSTKLKNFPKGFKKTMGHQSQSIFEQVIGTGGVRRLEAEYAIPIFENKAKTLRELCIRLRPTLLKLGYEPYETSGVFMRFVLPDTTSYLSMTSTHLWSLETQPLGFLFTILRTAPHEDKYRKFFYRMQRFFCLDAGQGEKLLGQFHWGKYWIMNRNFFRRMYSGPYRSRARDTFQRWLQTRNYLDPKKKFWNTHFNFLLDNDRERTNRNKAKMTLK